MRFLSFLLIASVVFISSCSKKNADDWVGTYNGSAGQAIQRVVVEKVNNSTLKIQLQTPFLGGFITYAVIGNAKITNSTTITVSEDGTIQGDPNNYRFTGTGNLNGKSLSISGAATNKSNASDVKYYSFTGSR